MTTECYAMVRGAGLRVTALDSCGSVGDTVRYSTSRSVIRVQIEEVTDTKSPDLIRSDSNDPRIRLTGKEETIRYVVGIEFVRVEPSVLSLVAGVPIVINAAGQIVGFDANTKMESTSFALEVWSRLVGESCVWNGEGFDTVGFDTDPFGGGVQVRAYGYTLFPFLSGGRVSGFSIQNGRVSFNVVGAQTRRLPRWSSGPYDIEGPWQRLVEPVGPGVNWRTMKTLYGPPEETDGIVEFVDEIDGGTAFVTTDDEIDGGDAVLAGPWEIDGGGA